MELRTISEVSKHYGISTRTLRYYEQIGLIKPIKKEDFAYRTYDEDTVVRLKQIIILRKLRIPLKDIARILPSDNIALAIEVFRQSLSEIGDEITALTVIRGVLRSFLERLNVKSAGLRLLDDESLLEIVDSLTVSKINFKEDRTMDELNKANEKLSKLTDKDVRIVYLPPATVASSHYIGDEPEYHAAVAMDNFVRQSGLTDIKPDIRQYGFNHPNPGCIEGSDTHGYEFWVTIPDDMEVPAPLIKKYFTGGLYAAHMIPMGAFEEWGWLWDWAHNNEKYDADIINDNGQCMNGLLEEHLNYKNNVGKLLDSRYDNIQLDLLIPIKEKR
ncbi:MAG: effector binding domain-containing protein [Eubacteriales bacterium]